MKIWFDSLSYHNSVFNGYGSRIERILSDEGINNASLCEHVNARSYANAGTDDTTNTRDFT